MRIAPATGRIRLGRKSGAVAGRGLICSRRSLAALHTGPIRIQTFSDRKAGRITHPEKMEDWKMRAGTFIRVRLMLLKASVAMAFAVAPFHIVVHPDGAGFELASVFAKDGGSGGGSSGSGRGGDDGGNDDNSGPGNGDDRGNNDNSGPGNGDDRANNDDDDRDDDDRDEHVNPATGARVEIEGNNIEVVFPDGTKEEIEAGRFERKNALGRTIVERPATGADFARLRATAR
jgi:hypothetical protein